LNKLLLFAPHSGTPLESPGEGLKCVTLKMTNNFFNNHFLNARKANSQAFLLCEMGPDQLVSYSPLGVQSRISVDTYGELDEAMNQAKNYLANAENEEPALVAQVQKAMCESGQLRSQYKVGIRFYSITPI